MKIRQGFVSNSSSSSFVLSLKEEPKNVEEMKEYLMYSSKYFCGKTEALSKFINIDEIAHYVYSYTMKYKNGNVVYSSPRDDAESDIIDSLLDNIFGVNTSDDGARKFYFYQEDVDTLSDFAKENFIIEVVKKS